MAIQMSVAVRNARLDAIETIISTTAKVQIWSGAVPADCTVTPVGTKLAEWTLASDWSAAASGGTKSLSSTPLATTGLAAGTATFFRIMNNAATVCGLQGTAGTSGTDMILDNAVIAVSQAVNITAFTLTEPGA